MAYQCGTCVVTCPPLVLCGGFHGLPSYMLCCTMLQYVAPSLCSPYTHIFSVTKIRECTVSCLIPEDGLFRKRPKFISCFPPPPTPARPAVAKEMRDGALTFIAEGMGMDSRVYARWLPRQGLIFPAQWPFFKRLGKRVFWRGQSCWRTSKILTARGHLEHAIFFIFS